MDYRELHPTGLTTDFVHLYENNPTSQEQLDTKRIGFNKGCMKVLDYLVHGGTLTTRTAMEQNISMHLARRIKDLRDKGVAISDRWLTDDQGRQTCMQWYMTEEQREVAIDKWIEVK